MRFWKIASSYFVFIFLNPLHDCASVMTRQVLWLQVKDYQYECSQTMYFTPIYAIPDELLMVGHVKQLRAQCSVLLVLTWQLHPD